MRSSMPSTTKARALGGEVRLEMASDAGRSRAASGADRAGAATGKNNCQRGRSYRQIPSGLTLIAAAADKACEVTGSGGT